MKTKYRRFLAIVLLLCVLISISGIPACALTLATSPKAPSELTAAASPKNASIWKVNLEWQDNSANETGFKIYRRIPTVKAYTLIDTVSANTVEYLDTTVALGKTYFYYVTAYNAVGSKDSDFVSVAVTATEPDAPTDVLAVGDSETNPAKITVTWTDNSDNESGFIIGRRDLYNESAAVSIGTVLANVKSFADTDIDPDIEGTFYLYWIFSQNDIGIGGDLTDYGSVPMSLKAPSDFTATADVTEVTLTWTDNSALEDSYKIYRCTDGSSYSLVDTVSANSTSYTDSGLEENTTYYYSIGAYYETEPQLSSQEATCTVTTGAEAVEPPVETYEFPFTDVPDGAWYRSDVETAHKNGLINGKSATLYCPGDNMSIAEAVKLAACMNKLYHEGSVTLTNGSPYWYSSYVTYATDNWILLREYEDYDALITRSEFVNIFYYALPSGEYPEINTVGDGAIPDVAMWDPYASLIYQFYRAGILVGSDSAGTFNQSSYIMRSEVAAILTRMFDDTARKNITLT